MFVQYFNSSICLLCDCVAKALADPVVEELAQYMALKTTSGDLETPTGTPLKGVDLRTPFKQIAEETASEPLVINDATSPQRTSFGRVSSPCVLSVLCFKYIHSFGSGQFSFPDLLNNRTPLFHFFSKL